MGRAREVEDDDTYLRHRMTYLRSRRKILRKARERREASRGECVVCLKIAPLKSRAGKGVCEKCLYALNLLSQPEVRERIILELGGQNG